MMNFEKLEELWPTLPDETFMLGCKLVLTCGACPEQYDVFLGEENIGYLRLRHGRFYAEYVPTKEIVYVAHPQGDGIFEESEREEHLLKAVTALLKKHNNIPDQVTVYLLNMETSDQYGTSKTVGVYSTRQLADSAAWTIGIRRGSIKEMILDAEPKGGNQ